MPPDVEGKGSLMGTYEGLARPIELNWRGLIDNILRKGTPKRVHHIELYHDGHSRGKPCWCPVHEYGHGKRYAACWGRCEPRGFVELFRVEPLHHHLRYEQRTGRGNR